MLTELLTNRIGKMPQSGKKRNPDVMPGVKDEGTAHMAIVSSQSTIVNRFVHPPGLEPGTH